MPMPSEVDAMSIGALNDDATVLDAAIQQVRIDSVLGPVQRLAPGILDWARARLLRALQGGTTFASISRAQEWLGQQVAQNFYDPKDGYTFEIRRVLGDLLSGGFLSRPPMTPEVEAKVQDYYVTQVTHDYSLEDHVDQAMANRRATSRTAAGTLDSMSRDPMLEGLEELLAEKRAKERMPEKFPTVMALVMARTMKRVAAKYADFGLARRAKYLEKEALSALKNGQSALSNPREINAGRSATPGLDSKSDRVRLPTPSELDEWPGLDEANERLLAEKRAEEAAKKGTTAAALVMARMMKRIAIKYADLNLAREANSLHKEALSALKKRQSALNSQPETNSEGRERPPTPAPDQKSLKDRARLPSSSELDSWMGLGEALEKMVGERAGSMKQRTSTSTALPPVSSTARTPLSRHLSDSEQDDLDTEKQIATLDRVARKGDRPRRADRPARPRAQAPPNFHRRRHHDRGAARCRRG